MHAADRYSRILEREEPGGPFKPGMALDVLREVAGPIDADTKPTDVRLVIEPYGAVKAAMPYFMLSDNAIAQSAHTVCLMFSDGSALLALRNHGIERDGEVELHLLPEPISVNWRVTNLTTGGEVRIVDHRPNDARGRRFIYQETGAVTRLAELNGPFTAAWCRDPELGGFAHQILDEVRDLGVRMARQYYDMGPNELREMPAALRPAPQPSLSA